MQTKEHIIYINDEIEVNQVREERKNPSLQTKISKMSGASDQEKIKQILQQLQT